VANDNITLTISDSDPSLWISVNVTVTRCPSPTTGDVVSE